MEKGDVLVWFKQVQLAKSLLKLKDLAVIVPLFFDSPAFTVYDQLSNEELCLPPSSFQLTTSFGIGNGEAERQLTYFWSELNDLLVWLTLPVRRTKSAVWLNG